MPVRPLLLHRMALVSFRLWANGLPPPLAKNFPYAYESARDAFVSNFRVYIAIQC